MFKNLIKAISNLLINIIRFVSKTNRNELRAKVFLHFVGNGEWKQIHGHDISVQSPDFDINVFSNVNFPKSVDYKGQRYNYEDTIKESFIRNGRRIIVVHARYLLDTEVVNFRNFVETLTPADFISA